MKLLFQEVEKFERIRNKTAGKWLGVPHCVARDIIGQVQSGRAGVGVSLGRYRVEEQGLG